MAARRKAQTSIYETDLTEHQPELLEALKSRAAMADRKSTANQNFDTADTRARDLITKLELGDDVVVRIGEFIITSKMARGRDVSFKTDAKLQVRIKPFRE